MTGTTVPQTWPILAKVQFLSLVFSSAVSGLPTLPVFSIDRHMLVVATNFFVKNNGTKVMPFFTATFKAVPQGQCVFATIFWNTPCLQ